MENLEQMVQEVQYLDNNDEAFLAKLREPLFLDSHHKDIFYDALEQFLKNICQQDFQNAFRRTLFGWNMYHTNYIKDMAYTYKKIQSKKRQRLTLRIKNKLKRLKIMKILEYLRVKITGK